MQSSSLKAIFAAIDEINGQSPLRAVDQPTQPRELLYGQRMSAWLEQFEPDASDALKIAARAQHIRRWDIPRASFPMDRAGYHRWRTTLYAHHATVAGNLLKGLQVDDATIAQVEKLLRKERLKSDPQMQTLEDVICLVFLEFEFADFLGQKNYEDEKVFTILRRTWGKMSESGHAAALELLPTLPAEAQRLIRAALA